MSFSLSEIIASVIYAIIFGIGFSAIWTPISLIFKSALSASLGVVFFALGFLLLSYFTLDGMLRGYMLVFAFSSFILTKKYIFEKLADFLKKLAKKVANIPIFGILKQSHTLDKSKKK